MTHRCCECGLDNCSCPLPRRAIDVRAAREELGLTQKELARALKTTRQSVYNWERPDWQGQIGLVFLGEIRRLLDEKREAFQKTRHEEVVELVKEADTLLAEGRELLSKKLPELPEWECTIAYCKLGGSYNCEYHQGYRDGFWVAVDMMEKPES